MNLAHKAVKQSDVEAKIIEEKSGGLVIVPEKDQEFPFSSVKAHELLNGLTEYEKTQLKTTKTAKGISVSLRNADNAAQEDFWDIPTTARGKRDEARQMKIEQEVME